MLAATTCSLAPAPSAARRNTNRRGSRATRRHPSASGPTLIATQSPTATTSSRTLTARSGPAAERTVIAPRSIRDTRPGPRPGPDPSARAAAQLSSQPSWVRTGDVAVGGMVGLLGLSIVSPRRSACPSVYGQNTVPWSARGPSGRGGVGRAPLDGDRTAAPDVFVNVVTNWCRAQPYQRRPGVSQVVHAVVHRLPNELERTDVAAAPLPRLVPGRGRQVDRESDEADRVLAQDVEHEICVVVVLAVAARIDEEILDHRVVVVVEAQDGIRLEAKHVSHEGGVLEDRQALVYAPPA